MNKTQKEAYQSGRELKEHEAQLLDKIILKFANDTISMLDIGCADGLFCRHLSKALPKSSITGIDISEKFISQAKSHNHSNCKFLPGNAESFIPDQPFDLIVASGILSVFDDFEPLLKKWLSWLKPDGTMIVFGRFNSMDIDVKISFRNNLNQSGWEGGLNAYSIATVGKFLKNHGYKYEFSKFHLEKLIPKQDDPIRTYTVITEDGDKMIVNGANLIAEHFHLTINK